MGLVTRCAAILVLALLAVSTGWGDDFVWSGPASGGTWQGANWNQGLSAGPACSYIPIPSASVYIGSGNSVTVGNGCAAAGNLTLAAGAQLVIPAMQPSGVPQFWATSAVHNAGDIQVGTTTSGAGSLLTGASTGYSNFQGATFDGGGTVTLTNGSTITVAPYGIDTNHVVLINQTIQGDGLIDETNLDIQSLSKIDANHNGLTLLMNSQGANGVVTNNGVMQASGGGILQLGASHWTGGPIHITQGSGGVIQALDGSTVMLGYIVNDPLYNYDVPGSITGGTLTTSGSGHIDVREDFLLDGVTNASNISVLYGGTSTTNGVQLANIINNTGTISLVTAGINIAAAGATLTGGGTVNMGGNVINGSGATLTNVNNLIQSSGSISNIVLNNQSLIDSNQSGGAISVSGAAVTNSGTMRAINGGTLLFSNGSYTGAGGTVQAGAGSTVTFQSATIGGTTTFSGPVTAYNSTLQNLNMSGNLVTTQATAIGGTFTNAGQLDVYNDVTLAYSASAPLTFNGPGTTWFHGGLRASGDSEDPTHPAVTNNSTLRGSFAMDLGYGNFINNGTLYAASGDSISVTGGYGSWGNAYSTNNGTYRVDAGGTMAIGQLTNHDGSTQTLTGGTYSVAGTLKLADNWAPAYINNNAANLILDGPSASVLAWFKVQNSTTDALAGFNNNMTAGSFTLVNGANFTSGSDFANAGAVNIGANSTFQVGPTGSLGTYTQTGGSTKLNGTLTAGTLNIAGGTLSGSGTLNAGLLVSGTLSPGNSPGTIVVNGDYTQASSGTLDIEAAMGQADFVDVHGNVTLDGTLDIIAYGNWSGSVNDHFLILDYTGTRTGDFATVVLPSLNGYQFSTEWEDHGLYLDITGNGPSGPGPVPEPSTATFLVLGAALLMGGYRLRRNH